MRTKGHRKYLASLAFVSCLSAVSPAMAAAPAPHETASAPVAVQQAQVQVPGLRDQAAMVLVGTALIGLAAALRRLA